ASADGRGSLVIVRSTIGTAKASILPEPVGDLTSTSSPASASGRASSWIRNGLWMERAASASTTGRDTPSSRKDCCDIYVRLLTDSRFADLETPEGGTRSASHRATGLPSRTLTVAVKAAYASIFARSLPVGLPEGLRTRFQS